MMQRTNWSSLAVAALVVLCGSVAQAAVVTLSYVNVQTADNLAFTTNVQNITPGGTININAGRFFRFGIAISITGADTVNPAAGGAWDLANQGSPNFGSPQPANLGAAVVNMQIFSNDPLGAKLTPTGTTGTGRTLSSVKFTTANPTPAAQRYTWGLTDPGDAGATLGGSGQIGITFPISSGNAAVDSGIDIDLQKLGYFTGTGSGTAPSLPSALTWFTGATFQAPALTGGGLVTLSPTLLAGSTNLWVNTSPGTVDQDNLPVNPATYGQRALAASFSGVAGDTVVNPSPFQFNVIAAPEPASLGLLVIGLGGLLGRRRMI